MATSTPLNGSSLVIRFTRPGTPNPTNDLVAFAQTATLTRTTETRDVTSKQTCGWRTIKPSLRSWSLSGDGFITYVAVSGEVEASAIHQLWESRELVSIQVTTWDCEAGGVISGDPIYLGSGYITQFEETGGVEDNATYSFTIEGEGVLTQDFNP